MLSRTLAKSWGSNQMTYPSARSVETISLLNATSVIPAGKSVDEQTLSTT